MLSKQSPECKLHWKLVDGSPLELALNVLDYDACYLRFGRPNKSGENHRASTSKSTSQTVEVL